MRNKYSKQDTTNKFFGVGGLNFKAFLEGKSPEINYFESLLNEKRQIQWTDLGLKLVAPFTSLSLPLELFAELLKLLYEDSENLESKKILFILVATPFFLVLATAIATPFIMLANLVDLIGSFIYTLADACCPQPSYNR